MVIVKQPFELMFFLLCSPKYRERALTFLLLYSPLCKFPFKPEPTCDPAVLHIAGATCLSSVTPTESGLVSDLFKFSCSGSHCGLIKLITTPTR